MKTSSAMKALAAFIILAATNCNKSGISPSKSRADCERQPSRSDSGQGNDTPENSPDYGLTYTCVSFDQSYDWQQDSLCGDVAFRLSLISGNREILTIDADPGGDISPSPGTHHIIGERLYTERQGPSGTVICRNGIPMFHFNTREVLKGLIEKEGSVYTLSSPLGTDGVILRKDGAFIMEKYGIHVHGSMSSPAYRPNGALYIFDDKVSFMYSDSEGVNIVCEGVVTRILWRDTEACCIDARMLGYGNAAFIFSRYARFMLDDVEIFKETEKGYHLGGTYREWDRMQLHSGIISGNSAIHLCNGEAYVYSDETLSGFAVREEEDGSVSVWFEHGKDDSFSKKGRFLTRSCADFSNGCYAVAIAPRGEGRAVLITDKGEKELDINGYVSCVRVNPPMR